MSSPLFNAIVRQSGLSDVFAADTIASACERAGVSPEKLTAGDMPRLLPEVGRALRLFLPKDEAENRLVALKRLTFRW